MRIASTAGESEDIDIAITANVLTLKGEAKEEHEEKAESVYRRERRHGTFVRQFTLPCEVDSAKADAARQSFCESGARRVPIPI